jgi:hypothetical protein
MKSISALDALTTYLQDHLAGAMHAIELLKAMRSHHGGEPSANSRPSFSPKLRRIGICLLD